MDEAGLPQVGDVFVTGSLIFNNGDHALERPVVVVRAPNKTTDYVTVIQRSTTADKQKGIDHPVDTGLGCDKWGRWVIDYQRAARCDQFLAASTHMGLLPEEYLIPLIEMWEQT